MKFTFLFFFLGLVLSFKWSKFAKFAGQITIILQLTFDGFCTTYLNWQNKKECAVSTAKSFLTLKKEISFYLHKLLRGEWHNVANKSEGSRVRKA